jgi:hypothetical protein
VYHELSGVVVCIAPPGNPELMDDEDDDVDDPAPSRRGSMGRGGEVDGKRHRSGEAGNASTGHSDDTCDPDGDDPDDSKDQALWRELQQAQSDASRTPQQREAELRLLLTDEQRFAAFKNSHLPHKAVKQVVANVLGPAGAASITRELVFSVSGICKLFVGDLVTQSTTFSCCRIFFGWSMVCHCIPRAASGTSSLLCRRVARVRMCHTFVLFRNCALV